MNNNKLTLYNKHRYSIINEDFFDSDADELSNAMVSLNGDIEDMSPSNSSQYIVMVDVFTLQNDPHIDRDNDKAISLVPAYAKKLLYALGTMKQFSDIDDDYELYVHAADPGDCTDIHTFANGVRLHHNNLYYPAILNSFGIAFRASFNIRSFSSYINCLKTLNRIQNIAPYFSPVYILFYNPENFTKDNVCFSISNINWLQYNNITTKKDKRRWDNHPYKTNMYQKATKICGPGAVQHVRDYLGVTDDNWYLGKILTEKYGMKSSDKNLVSKPVYIEPSNPALLKTMIQNVFTLGGGKIYMMDSNLQDFAKAICPVKTASQLTELINSDNYNFRIKVCRNKSNNDLYSMYFLSKSVIIDDNEYDYVLVNELPDTINAAATIAKWLFPMVLCGNAAKKLVNGIFQNIDRNTATEIIAAVKNLIEDTEWN